MADVDVATKILGLSSLLASGILSLEEFNVLKASLLQGTPVESQPSSAIPPSSVISTSTSKSARLKRPSSVLDLGITKKVKGSDGVLWNVVPSKDILPIQKASHPDSQ